MIAYFKYKFEQSPSVIMALMLWGIPTVTHTCFSWEEKFKAKKGPTRDYAQEKENIMKEMSSFFFLLSVAKEPQTWPTQEPSLDLFLVIILIAAKLVCAKYPSLHLAK